MQHSRLDLSLYRMERAKEELNAAKEYVKNQI